MGAPVEAVGAAAAASDEVAAAVAVGAEYRLIAASAEAAVALAAAADKFADPSSSTMKAVEQMQCRQTRKALLAEVHFLGFHSHS